MTIKLYGEPYWYSPYFFTVFVALREKELSFDVQVINLAAGEQRTPEFIAKSLTNRIPTIEHDGFSLSESTAIVEYLDDKFTAPKHPRVLPENTEHRARARQLQAWLRSDLAELRQERSTEIMLFTRDPKPMSPGALAMAEKLFRVAEAVVPAQGDHLFGQWSIADADLAFALHRLILSGDHVPPRLHAYASKQWQRASVREFIDRERKGPVAKY